MVTQEDVELAYQEAMMNMARLNRTGTGAPAAGALQALGQARRAAFRAGLPMDSLSCGGLFFLHISFHVKKKTLLSRRSRPTLGQIWSVTADCLSDRFGFENEMCIYILYVFPFGRRGKNRIVVTGLLKRKGP